MENNQNKKSVKFQGGMFNFCDFIQVFVFTKNHHLKSRGSELGNSHMNCQQGHKFNLDWFP